MKSFFIFLPLFFTSLLLNAQSNDSYYSINELINTSHEKKLSRENYWLTLLHINQGATLINQGSSYIDDDSFFLSKDGKDSPKKELEQSIKQLFTQPDLRCHYVARWRWLNEKLLGSYSTKSIEHCAEFIKWRDNLNADKMVLVFPASYLNSPSSMYGHTLIRLDPATKEGDDKTKIDWLSWAINYGAKTNNEDQSMFYAIKGLGGGYPGFFALQPYFEKIAEYNHGENRDIWEYYLNLTSTEVGLIVEHLWELRGKHFDYYFLDENCSFRLLELIQIAKPKLNLMSELRLAEIPVNTVRTITDNKLVSDIIYRPSKASTLTQWIKTLSTQEQTTALELVKNPDDPLLLTHYNANQQFKIIKTAYLHHQQKSSQQERTREAARINLALLKLLNQHASDAVSLQDINQDTAELIAPHKGHKTQTLKVGAKAYQDDSTVKLGYRYNYHDLLDNSRGYLKGANLEVFDIDIEKRTSSSTWQVESFDLLNIESLSPRNDFLQPLSWRVNVAFQRTLKQQEVFFVEAGAGRTWQTSNNSIFYAIPSLRIEHNQEYEQWLRPALAVKTGWLLQRSSWSAQLEYHSHLFNNEQYTQKASANAQFELYENNAVRLSISKHKNNDHEQNQGLIEWRHHF